MKLLLSIFCIIPVFSFSMNNENEVRSEEANKDLYLRNENGKRVKNYDRALLWRRVNDDIYHPYYNNGKCYLMKETFESYHATFDETMNTDDTTEQITASIPLFVQLCVQASKNESLSKSPFNELLDKIKSKSITADADTMTVCVTEKDISHRLLPYIHYGSRHYLVNGKKMEIDLYGLGTARELQSDYNVSSDLEHIQQVINEFENLMKSN